MTGWIKVHRKIEQWEWYTDANTFRLFFHLVLKANHAEKKWRGIIIERGQLVTSIDHLSKQLKLTPQQIRTSIKKLKSTGEITSESTNKYTLVTIEKYDLYQLQDEEITNQATSNETNEQQTNNKQITTNKNDKNNKNDKKLNIVSKDTISSTELLPIIKAWNDTGAPAVKSINANTNRYKLMKARIKEHGELEVIKAIRSIKYSPFLKGENSRNWIITFDWFIKPSNFIKVMEGNYLDKANKGGLDSGKHERAVNETDWDRREIEKALEMYEQCGGEIEDVDF